MSNRGTQLLKRVALATASLVFMLLLLEIALRAVLWVDAARRGTLEQELLRSRASYPPKDEEADFGDMVQASAFPDICYEFKPNMECIYRGARVITNSKGIRGPERTVEKPPNVFRTVGLGDSVMFGWGVEQDEFYLSVLERTLNSLPGDHPTYESMNFAVPGYNTAIEVATLEHKALQYSPDLVIIHFINNDFGVPSFMLAPRSGQGMRGSYLLDFLRARWGWLKRSYEEENLVYQDFRNIEEEVKANVLKEYQYMLGPIGYALAMDNLGRMAKDHGFKVIVMVGTLSPDQRGAVQFCANKWGFRVLDIGPYTRRVLARNGIADTPEEWKRVGWVAPGDNHPSAFAHTIYVEGLVETMQSLQLAPGSEFSSPPYPALP